MEFQRSLIRPERRKLVGRLARIFHPFTETALSWRCWIAIAIVVYASKDFDFLQSQKSVKSIDHFCSICSFLWDLRISRQVFWTRNHLRDRRWCRMGDSETDDRDPGHLLPQKCTSGHERLSLREWAVRWWTRKHPSLGCLSSINKENHN